jgi:hypothetical protein
VKMSAPPSYEEALREIKIERKYPPLTHERFSRLIGAYVDHCRKTLPDKWEFYAGPFLKGKAPTYGPSQFEQLEQYYIDNPKNEVLFLEIIRHYYYYCYQDLLDLITFWNEVAGSKNRLNLFEGKRICSFSIHLHSIKKSIIKKTMV